MKELLRKAASKLGFDIKKNKSKRVVPFRLDYGHKLGYDLEDEADSLIRKVRSNTMLPYVDLVTLYEQTVFCETNEVHGSFVECGVWKGGAVGLMALANLKYGKQRRHIHLFDAFDDICEPDADVDGSRALCDVRRYAGDDAGAAGRLKPLRGFYSAFGGPGTIEENKGLLEKIIGYPPDYLHYHKGWFQNTLPKDYTDIGEIAILRLDGDWYASIKLCLHYLYDKVVPGGFIIIDDYGYYEGCKRAVDEFIAQKKLKVFLHYAHPATRYWIKS